jgi:hypothetical protein
MVFQMNASGNFQEGHRCIKFLRFPKCWKEAKIKALPKPGKDHKFLSNIHLISILTTTGKLVETVILKILKRRIERKNCLMQVSTTLQCMMRLTGHIPLVYSCSILGYRKRLTLYGTQACYINYLKWNFQPL